MTAAIRTNDDTGDAFRISMSCNDAAALLAAGSIINAWFAALSSPEARSPAGLIGAMHENGLLDIRTEAEGGQQVATQTQAFLGALVRVGEALAPVAVEAGSLDASTRRMRSGHPEAPAQQPSGRLPAGESEGARS